ncbi:MAG: serine/threonine-protein kinase [Myxococcota bacterium]|nr:serine/threonine-protein kinase [Myxococcota bacterium]
MQPGEIVAGRFRICGTLGRGGHGEVLRGEHVQLGYPVALKMLDPEYKHDDAMRERFRREAIFGARLCTENVARVLDAGETDDSIPFLIMEMIEGPDLATVLDRERTLPIAAAVDLGVQLCAAVSALEEHELVHRDIKPSNVVLKREADGRVIVKLIDLGISRDASEEGRVETLTAANTIVGTPQYMAPEQIEAGVLDHRTDLYAIGAVLFEALAGEPPYGGKTPHAVLARALAGEREDLAKARPGVPEPLVKVIERALAFDPSDRFPDAAAMSRALSRAAEESELPRGARAWQTVESVREELAGESRRSAMSDTTDLLASNVDPFEKTGERRGFRHWDWVAAVVALVIAAVSLGTFFVDTGERGRGEPLNKQSAPSSVEE